MKLLGDIIETVVALLLLPLVIIYRAVMSLMVLLFIIAIVCSPFIFLGWIVWLIAR